jgi:F-type H+-transporting ATPase subunit gamma
MPSLIDIRRRIRAVKSTQQITKAMKMVAASKLRHAQERVLGARPFAHQMLRMLNRLASRVDPSTHPLLTMRDEAGPNARALLFVITADKGLCGSFNSHVIKAAGGFVADRADRAVALGLVGRKGRDYFRRFGFDVRYEQIGLFVRVRYEDAEAIGRAAIEEFTTGRADCVYLVYSEFKSIMQQRIVVERLLPIPRFDEAAQNDSEEARAAAPVPFGVDYLYEPPPQRIFADLLPRHVEVQVYHALLESAAAEHAARMTAMDSATKNSTELIDDLTLYMNKVRQAAITREIIEVVSGAQGV